MLNGICPKCGAHEVYSGAEVIYKSNQYHMNSIPIKGSFLTSYVALNNYVCVECGYVESYIEDPGKAEEISRHWPKVPVVD